MFENITLKNVLVFLLVAAVVYYLYVNYMQEGFAEKHHHHVHHTHHAHHAHHASASTPVIAKTEEAIKVETPGEVWGVNSANQIWKSQLPCENGICNWTEVPGALKQVSQGHHDVWGTAPGAWASIWRCEKPCNGDWKSIPGSLKQVSVGKDVVWGVNDNGNIYYCPNTQDAPCTGNWVGVDGGLTDVSIN